MPSDKEVAEEFIAKQDAATEGPWGSNYPELDNSKPSHWCMPISQDKSVGCGTPAHCYGNNRPNNVNFIVYARNSTIGHRLLAVVDENERLRELLDASECSLSDEEAAHHDTLRLLYERTEENRRLWLQLAEAAEHIKEIVENGPDEQYLADAAEENAEYYVNLREFLNRITNEQSND